MTEERTASIFRSPKLLVGLLLALGVVAAIQIAGLAGNEKASAHEVVTTLRAGNSGKCLAVHPSAFYNGAITYQWTCAGPGNIEIEDAGSGWHYIKFTHSGKCLTVNGYAWWDGGTLDQWDCVGQSNQKWSGNFVNNVFEVHASQANPTKCITVHAESTANGAWVNQWQCVYQANQAWIMEPVGPTPTATRTRTPTPTPTPTATPMPGDGQLTITKLCVPPADPGKFNIRVQGVIQGADVVCGGVVGPISLAAGTYSVSETAGTGTDLSDYTVTFGGDCNSSGQVAVVANEEAECTITNDHD